MRVNNHDGMPNYSQRLNPDDPSTPWNETLETCNVTAGATAIMTASWDLQKLNRGFHTRPPMDILLFMRQDSDCNALYAQLDPASSQLNAKMKAGYAPSAAELAAFTPMNELMDVLGMAIGKYIGIDDMDKLRSMVSYSKDLIEIRSAIERGDGLVIHGLFTFARKDGSTIKGGHFESLGGFDFDDSVAERTITAWIVDDPYGNPNTNYIDTAGNDIVLDDATFKAVIKPVDNMIGKDVIIIPRPGLDGKPWV
jgi:hypothetical protein